MDYIIITGASKGLGEAIAYRLLSEGSHLFCISRERNHNLLSYAGKEGYPIEYIEFDLSKIEGIEGLTADIFKKIDDSSLRSMTLINNAGSLDPIKPIDKCTSYEITYNMKINAIAPMIMALCFIKQTNIYKCRKMVINISSGAGKNPYYGWSAYCSSKAALDMFTRVTGIEQEKREDPVKIISFAPGIIDTDMQEGIRRTASDDFELVDKFIRYKREGRLLKPSFVAEKVVGLIFDEDIKQGGVYDIKEFIDD